jgi:GNAT superfamily N-acetyltransferase
MSFAIKQATIRDLDILTPLFDDYRQFYRQPADLSRARHFLAERFRHHESLILLAQDNANEGLGFTQLYPLFSSMSTERIYLLNDLFVADAARRHGVGKALLASAVDHARLLGAARLLLSTARDNVAAQALYESLEWQRDRQFYQYGIAL